MNESEQIKSAIQERFGPPGHHCRIQIHEKDSGALLVDCMPLRSPLDDWQDFVMDALRMMRVPCFHFTVDFMLPDGSPGFCERPQGCKRMKFETDHWPIIPAKWFRRITNGRRRVRVIVIHAMQSQEIDLSAENVGRWFQITARPSSAHIGVDRDSIVQYVRDNDIAFAAPGVNNDGIHIELAGMAEQTGEQWLDDYGKQMLDRAANAVAQYCLKYGLPCVKLAPQQLKEGKRGVIGHWDATQVYKPNAGHTDPGKDFPWAWFIARANEHISKLKGNAHKMKKLITPISAIVLMVACFSVGQIALLKAALRSSPPLVNSLVASGAIKQADADTVIKDFTDAAGEAIELGECLKAVPKAAPDQKQQQYKCAHGAFTDWRAIANRGHFKIHPKVETAFTIADGIFEFVDAFYADRAGTISHADVGADGLSDEEFQDVLEFQIKQLKEAMKP